MVLQFSVLVLYVNEPAVKFLRWHGENLVGAFVKPISESIHGQEVARLPAVD
jgi:hypothetical protein